MKNILDEFMIFLGKEDLFLGLERIKQQDRVEDFFGNSEASKYFYGLFEEGTGSIICTWQYESNSNEKPIVWLDSEGIPISVIANNFKDFLSLMYYGYGMIWHAASNIENFNPLYFDGASEPEEFSQDKLLKYKLDEIKEHEERYNAFLQWCETNGISPNESPIRTIEKAISNHPKLDEWLEDKGLI